MTSPKHDSPWTCPSRHNRKEFQNQGVNCIICLHMSAVSEMVAPLYKHLFILTYSHLFQCWFAPIIFLEGIAVSCLLLVKHYDQRHHLPYQKPSGHPAVLSQLFAVHDKLSFPFLHDDLGKSRLPLKYHDYPLRLLFCKVQKIFNAFVLEK